MKIIRITKNCALRFLEEAHKPGGRAEHLAEAHENMMFKDGAVNVLGGKKKHTTIVRFLPAASPSPTSSRQRASMAATPSTACPA